MVSSDLLEILRCPHCVRENSVGSNWSRHVLVCQEPDCHRKYPIRDDIPVMLIGSARNG